MASSSATQRKRCRTAVPTDGCYNITQLPDSLLVGVAEYLPKTPCALFAAALSAGPSSWERCNWKCQPSATSKAIANCCSEQWDILDFMDIEKSVRMKLSDGDVGAILACIDGVKKVKRLKLTHCYGVSGKGLKPIKQSVVLEQVDLSLVEQIEDPFIKDETLLSDKDVIPILKGIFSNQSNSFKHLQLPRSWAHKDVPLCDEFIRLLSRTWSNDDYELSCAKCDGEVEEILFDLGSPLGMYGMQSNTCFQCLRHFCNKDVSEHDNEYANMCFKCYRMYCQACVKTGFCHPCDEYICVNCKEMTQCLQCEENFCNDHILTCQNCHSDGCPVCSSDTSDEVEGCDLCGKSFCFECRRQECEKDWNECCPGCLRLIAPLLNNAYTDELL